MIDAVYNRISTRTYKKEPLTVEEIHTIKDIVEYHKNISGPFEHSFDFTFDLNTEDQSQGKKIGTYGLIRNVPAFVGGVSKNSFDAIVDFGFVFESLLLALTKKGYDTCWLGGTFNRRHYRQKLSEHEIIPAISPVRHRAEKRALADRIIRTAAKARNRLDSRFLFKDYNNELPFDMENDSFMTMCLKLVQLGPSASNKQPWRLYVDKDVIHFYIQRTKQYPPISLGYDIQALDIGISLCHFSIGLTHFEKTYHYQKREQVKSFPNQDYIISICINPSVK
ncbi:MAG: nitroreductase [Bacilli bacterium]|nr:nitroreductase [Bacilli bacterium]